MTVGKELYDISSRRNSSLEDFRLRDESEGADAGMTETISLSSMAEFYIIIRSVIHSGIFLVVEHELNFATCAEKID